MTAKKRPTAKAAKAAKPRRAAAAPAPAPLTVTEFPLADGPKRHPALGVGLWALGRWSRDDEARTKATIGRAVERGIRWFDTAEVYGNGRSERLLGEVLDRAPTPASESFIVTKVSWEHLRPSQIRPAVIGSLQRLGLRSVDLYLVHAPNPRVPIAETIGSLKELKDEGRIGALGVSNFSVDQMEEARKALGDVALVVNQIRCNLLDPQEAEEIREYCRQNRILIEAYTPLARGVLAGRYLDGEPVPAEVRRFARDLFEGDRWTQIVERARAIRKLAESSEVPLLSVALHWLARQGFAPVCGASRPEQIDALLAAWAIRPEDALLDEAEEIARGHGG